MSKPYYKQCRLRNVDGILETVAWIDEKGAVIGATMTLDGFPGLRFEVIEVFNRRILESEVKETQRLDRGSLPSIK